MDIVTVSVSLDLDGILEFNANRKDSWGHENSPLDVADFTSIVYSGDVETWRGHHEIISLASNTTYQFKFSLNQLNEPNNPIEVQPYIKFGLVNKEATKDWWNGIFENSSAITISDESLDLSLDDPKEIGSYSGTLTTVDEASFSERSNIQYSWQFYITVGGEMKYCQIDPYIKIRPRN